MEITLVLSICVRVISKSRILYERILISQRNLEVVKSKVVRELNFEAFILLVCKQEVNDIGRIPIQTVQYFSSESVLKIFRYYLKGGIPLYSYFVFAKILKNVP